jgi:hypothetical protein
MKHKFSIKELELLVMYGGLIYPEDKNDPDYTKKLQTEQDEYLKSVGATDEDLDFNPLVHEEFWFYASELVIKLAEELLDERQRKYDSLIEPIEYLETELKNLKRKIKSNFK